MTELKPCPFCGGEAKHNNGGNSTYGRLWWSVWCDECEVQMSDKEAWNHGESNSLLKYPAKECFDRWNRRDSDAELEQAVGFIFDRNHEIDRLRTIEAACKRLAYIVRKSVNSGPLSRDPTQEAEAWRQLRVALGEGYDERGNLVPIGEGK